MRVVVFIRRKGSNNIEKIPFDNAFASSVWSTGISVHLNDGSMKNFFFKDYEYVGADVIEEDRDEPRGNSAKPVQEVH